MITTGRADTSILRDIESQSEMHIANLDGIITVQQVFGVLQSDGEFLQEISKDTFGIIPDLMDDLRRFLKQEYERKIEELYNELRSKKNEENV